MAAIAFGPKIARANLARLHVEMAEKELCAKSEQIAMLAGKALTGKSFSQDERRVMRMLASRDVERVIKFCNERQFPLLKLIMKLAPQVNIDQVARMDDYLRYDSEKGFRISMNKNFYGVAEEIIPEIYLSGIKACINCHHLFDDDDKPPLIISLLGGHEPEIEHYFEYGEDELALFGINDCASGFRRMIALSSEPKARVDQWFEKVFRQMDEARLAKRKVLIHCYAGQSRSSTFLAAYLIKRFGLSADEAIRHLMYKRNAVMPNKNFIKHLRAYSAKIALWREK